MRERRRRVLGSLSPLRPWKDERLMMSFKGFSIGSVVTLNLKNSPCMGVSRRPSIRRHKSRRRGQILQANKSWQGFNWFGKKKDVVEKEGATIPSQPDTGEHSFSQVHISLATSTCQGRTGCLERLLDNHWHSIHALGVLSTVSCLRQFLGHAIYISLAYSQSIVYHARSPWVFGRKVDVRIWTAIIHRIYAFA